MRTGVVNREKIIAILNRYRVGPDVARPGIIQELVQALTETADQDSLDSQEPPPPPSARRGEALKDMRAMLDWPEVKASPRATAKIARLCRSIREANPS